MSKKCLILVHTFCHPTVVQVLGRNCSKFGVKVRLTGANSVEQDQTPQNAASDLDSHCLPLIRSNFETPIFGELSCLNVTTRSVKC